MLELLYRILIGHNHKWKTVETMVATRNSLIHDRQICIGKVYICRCEICGKMGRYSVDVESEF